MDIAWQSICETISLSGPHGISWQHFKNEIKQYLRLRDEELKWPPGPALKYILCLYAGLSPNYQISQYNENHKVQKDLKLKLLNFTKLEPFKDSLLSLDESSVSGLRFYCSNDSLRHKQILNGRPLQLSESSLVALEIIASHHLQGLTQAELARSMGCDPKSVFHWLKCLISNDLIVRTPVASKKSFTYLLTLTRFLDEEILIQPVLTSSSNKTGHTTVVSSKEIRQIIVDILAKAPNQTMASADVFLLTGLDRNLIKNYRRAATKLNEIGWLEYLFNDQLMGPYCRLFRLNRKPSEGLDLKKFLDSLEENIKKKDMEIVIYKTPRGAVYCPEYPIIHQIIYLLARSYPIPLTTADLSHHLAIPRKYLYRLIEKMFPISSTKKAGVIGAEGVGKVADFVGKEKRIKLFIINEEWKSKYIKLFSESRIRSILTDLTRPNINDFSPENANVLSRPTSPNSTPLQSPLFSFTQSPSETRTRQLRHQALLSELADHQILDIGKELCARLQSRLGDARFTMDVKTLRRSADILEKEGLLKIIVTSAPTGSKTLLISPDLTIEDQIVKDRISSIRENVRTGPLSASTQKLFRLKELMQESDYFVEGSLPLSKLPQNSSPALTKFGFVFGVLARAQLFHQFLLNFAKFPNADGQYKYFETMPTIFEQIPLGLYCKIIGMVRMSRELFSGFHDENLDLKPIGELCEGFKEELGLNRKRFQAQTALLLQTLEQLQLIQGEVHFSSIKFKFAFKYNFALEVPIYNFKGQVKKFLKFDSTKNEIEAFNKFWTSMREIATEFQAHQTHFHAISIHKADSEEIDNLIIIPKPILLARYSDSWKIHPNRERDLERSVRKLAVELFSLEKSKRRRTNNHLAALVDSELDTRTQENVQSLSTEFEISPQIIGKMLEKSQRQLVEREEARRLDKLAAQRSNLDSSESENDGEEETALNNNFDIEHLRWSPIDRSKLSLAFCILQQPHFLTNSSGSNVFGATAGGVKWQLAARIFDKPKDPVIIRRQGLKLCKSYEGLKKLIEMDSLVHLIMIRNSDSLTGGDSCFKEIFDACEKELINLRVKEVNEDSNDLKGSVESKSCLFDQFHVPTNFEGILVPLKSRKDHYLSSIESWMHTRAFRHGLILNTPGLGRKKIAMDNTSHSQDSTDILKLRQVLIYSTAEFPGNPQFDLETASCHLQSISPESLKNSIDHLIASGFASKTKGRDKYRVLGFSLSISEFLREIIEIVPDENCDDTPIKITNSTQNLSLNRIEEFIERKFRGEVEFCELEILHDEEFNRFDAPVLIKKTKTFSDYHMDNTVNNNNGNYHQSWQLAKTLKNSIWFSIDGTFLPILLTRSLNHLKRFIRLSPGISIENLKNCYRSGLEGFEVDALVAILATNGSIEVCNEIYLQ